MEVVSIKVYNIGKVNCYGCGYELDLESLKRVELSDGKVLFVCGKCCERLSKICSIDVQEIKLPNVDYCAKCLLRYKCFTTREEEDERPDRERD